MKYAHQTAGFGTLFSTLAALSSPARDFDPWRHASAALEAARRRRERARQRRALQHLDDRLLRDIGLSRADVGERLSSPFAPGGGFWHL